MPSQTPGFGLDSEYDPIRAVLLHKPGKEIAGLTDPASVQHLRPIDASILDSEYEALAGALKNLGIQTIFIDSKKMEPGSDSYIFNLMYARDLFFMTPKGAILSQMAGDVRKGEEKYAERALRENGVPVAGAIEFPGTFEGADALWLARDKVLVGVGNRTNREGFDQVKKLLEAQGVQVLSIAVPKDAQHLLGLLQVVDRSLALVRYKRFGTKAARDIKSILAASGITAINVAEDDEIVSKQAMNVVTVAPRTILMPADCPKSKKMFGALGLRVAAEIPISQLINGGGGLACATAILSRGPAPQRAASQGSVSR